MKNKTIILLTSLLLLGFLTSFAGNGPAESNVTVKTNAVKNITATSAQGGYTLTNAKGVVSRHGICLNRKPNPTISGAIFTGINTSGSDFTVQLTGLAPSTTFYIRAYATIGTSTIYGNELSFTTPSVKK